MSNQAEVIHIAFTEDELLNNLSYALSDWLEIDVQISSFSFNKQYLFYAEDIFKRHDNVQEVLFPAIFTYDLFPGEMLSQRVEVRRDRIYAVFTDEREIVFRLRLDEVKLPALNIFWPFNTLQ